MATASIARFEILETLGEGGMGRVYKARDPMLGRVLALKVLLPGAGDPDRRSRFMQEARAASSLNHPNIVTIYEVGRANDEVDFIAMEYVEGKPLSAVVPPGGLSAELTTTYGSQIAEAIEHAHAAGILHRDLKPANILVRSDGLVKVLDFGLAKMLVTGNEVEATRSILLESPKTQAGMLMGTVSYMSPEQAEARAVDVRSDVFSFGAVLYEMCTGRRAFDGDTQISVLAKVLRDDPPPVSGILNPIIARCLRKDPGLRFSSFREIRDALRQSQTHASGMTMAAPVESGSIAVLPFLDLSPQKDQEYLCDGLAEEILNALTRLRNIRVAARTSAFLFKNRTNDIREIGRQLNVGMVLEGSVRTAGNRLRVTTQLVDAAGGHQLWSERYDRDLSDVFAVQDEIAAAVVDALKGRCEMQPVSSISRRYTDNLEAYNLYLRGRHAWNSWSPQGFAEAKQCFEAAIEKDPDYALAWSGLADTHTAVASFGYLPPHEIYPSARVAARRALAIDPDLAEAHVSLGAVRAFYEWDWKGAEDSYRQAINRNPGYASAYHVLALSVMVPQRRLREANDAMTTALAMDPYSLPVMQSAHHLARACDDHPRAIELEAAMEKIMPTYPGMFYVRALRLLKEGRFEESMKAIDAFDQVIPDNSSCVAFRGLLHARMGRPELAEAALAQLDQMAAQMFVQQNDVAAILIALGRLDDAFAKFDRALASHDGGLMFCTVDPRFATIQTDPRFFRVLDQMGLRNGLS